MLLVDLAAAAILSIPAPAAEDIQTWVWTTSTGFESEHMYGVTRNESAGSAAHETHLTLSHQRVYKADPMARLDDGWWAPTDDLAAPYNERNNWRIRRYSVTGGNPLAWTEDFNGESSQDDEINGLAVTGAGNVVAVGRQDHDRARKGDNWRIRQYSGAATGGLMPGWDLSYTSPKNEDDVAMDVAVDPLDGSVVVVGYASFPDAGEGFNWVIRKYAASGAFDWQQQFNDEENLNDRACSVAIDSSGDIIAVGYETRTGLWAGRNWRINKYTSTGVLLWSASYSGEYDQPDEAWGVAVDAAGDIIVAGFETRDDLSASMRENWLLRKYDSGGSLLWSRTYRGTTDTNHRALGVAADASGGMAVVGWVDGGSGADWHVRTYTAAGATVWEHTYNGPANAEDQALGVDIDPATGLIIVAGFEYGTAGQHNWRIQAYGDSGATAWIQTYDSPAQMPDKATSVAVGADGTVYVGGFEWRSDLSPLARIGYPQEPTPVGFHGVALVGDWLYVLGGCENSFGSDPVNHCDKSGSRTTARVWISRIGSDGSVGPWKEAYYKFGDVGESQYKWGPPVDPKDGIMVWKHRMTAVRNRLYVVGGATTNCGMGTLPGSHAKLPMVLDVYSAEVDPVTGQTGPWEEEEKLPTPVVGHGLTYTAGALYVVGGVTEMSVGATSEMMASRDVSRANIRPDGSLEKWESVGRLPSADVECTCPGCCTPDNVSTCFGYGWFYAFSALRMIGFLGASHANEPLSVQCKYDRNSHYAFLDECNRVKAWYKGAGAPVYGSSRASVVVRDGFLMQVGGYHVGNLMDQTVYSPDYRLGLVRVNDAGQNAGDREEVRPGTPDGTELFRSEGSSDPIRCFSGAVADYPVVSHGDYMYAVGGSYTGLMTACDVVFRAMVPTTTWYIDAGYFVSRPYDLTGDPIKLVKLRGVSFTFSKTGAGRTPQDPDDWAMVRYRVAGQDGNWSCWTPRIPELGSVPTQPGMYAFSSRMCEAGVASDFPCVDSVLMQMPLIADSFRYIQFEVSLYNDSGNDYHQPTLPRFNEFRVEVTAGEAPPPCVKDLRLFPVPAGRYLTVQFGVVQEGGEVVLRIYNVAGELVAKEERRYISGGLQNEAILLERFAQGVYLIVVEGLAASGGPGLLCKELSTDPFRKVSGKFVVRR